MDTKTLEKAKELANEIEKLEDVEKLLKQGRALQLKGSWGSGFPLEISDEDHIKAQKYILRMVRATLRSKKSALNAI